MGLLSYELPNAERKDKMLAKVFSCWSKWHGRQNIENRSVEGSKKWLQEQLRGGFVASLCEIWSNMDDESLMKDCGFILPSPAWKLPENQPHAADIQNEDDMALTFIKLQVGMLFFRAKRCAPMMLGWSSRSSLFIKNDAEAKKEVARMNLDVERTAHFKKNEKKTPDVAGIAARALMDTTAVKQVVACAKLLKFDETRDPTTQSFDDQNSKLRASQVIEDGFNNMKNVKSNTARSVR